MNKPYSIGIDVGSTTVKFVVLDDDKNIIHKEYNRHFSDIKNTVFGMFENAKEILVKKVGTIHITGSAGINISKKLDAPFIQEVVACTSTIEEIVPEVDVAIELGGEDAKITYFGDVVEQRMNGTCAGGTGAFIDQMASLLQTDASGLNELAKNYKIIYPIASRCGVFAKTDIQPLLNEGASKEDVAVSVLQAVVNQTIGGLAQGRPIKGKVAFLGGPLFFMSELRKRFIETLKLTEDQVIFPADSQYFVAMGSALISRKGTAVEFDKLYKNINKIYLIDDHKQVTLPPLFKNENEYNEFKARHESSKVGRNDIATYKGKAYLGIDAGSTTTKVVLIDDEKRLLFSHYGSNQGKPLVSTIEALSTLKELLNDEIVIAGSTVTGYGEHLIKEALRIDYGEIETVAHYRAADYFLSGVDFVLDIGGQDMKSLKIHNGVIESIMLNEACSSGCGSFIETFAQSLQIEVKEFAKLGVQAEHPVDLGTRCTVFMNSKVKQAQKEGASVADISAGISLSVIKNALYKVIRMKKPEDLGEKIVVQGGTFYNEAVLRGIELTLGREVIRPDIAGVMGAFGAAIIAKDRDETGQTDMIDLEELKDFTVENSLKRCERCGNNCLMTISTFSNGKQFYSGNRCERGAGQEKKKNKAPNMYDFKYKRLFAYKSLPLKEASRGVIGLPRVLNMYEDYPFWFTFFNELGYRVQLSANSSKAIFEKGLESIPSESVCYPGKLVHGHLEDLLDKGIKKIFYPSIPYNIKEDPEADNHYNCPVVISYPETIWANLERLKDDSVTFYHPFLPIDHPKRMFKRLVEELVDENIPSSDLKTALDKAYLELEQFKYDIKIETERTLEYVKDNNIKGIVLAGRPYHLDKEINHGIDELIHSYGFAILCEDGFRDLKIERPIRAVDQWVYHTRLYKAADYVAKDKNLELIQLNSFGCGLDAVTTDQVQDILHQNNRLYTTIKIDEINNLGAARIRVRSLIAAIHERDRNDIVPKRLYENKPRPEFTKEMKSKHTILIPQMAPIHFQFLEVALDEAGYNVELLPSVDVKAIDEGLKVVHNDACYPSIMTVGQVIEALKSGKYDLNNVSVMMSQTGGGCRATNYIAFIRKALKDLDMDHIPVVSFNVAGLEKNPGFKLTPKLLKRLGDSVLMGDLLMRMLFRIRPYEKVPGSANKLYDKWVTILKDCVRGKGKKFNAYIPEMVREFDTFELDETLVKPKVGIVGEILVKFHPTANNQIVEFLEAEGAEAVMPDLYDFLLYTQYNNIYKYEELSGSYKSMAVSKTTIKVLENLRNVMRRELENSKRFHPPLPIDQLADKARPHLSIGNQTGEGWFLTAEMVELIDSGVDNVLCLQPFGCLPNHITGKGMIKELRTSYPKSNIVPIDYDPGASEVNQINRIKLMLSTAFKKIEKNVEHNNNITSIK